MQKQWDQEVDFDDALSKISHKAKEWNFSVFGNIHSRKARVLARIGGCSEPLKHIQLQI